MTLKIVKLEGEHIGSPLNPKEWNDFVLNSKNGSVFNTVEWFSVWNTTFKNTSSFCLIHKDKELVAGIPFIEIKNLGFKNYYSMPYGAYGGVISRGERPFAPTKNQKLELIYKFNKLTKGNWGILTISDFYDELDNCNLETMGFKKLKLTTHLLSLDSGIETIQSTLSPTKKHISRNTAKYGLKISMVKNEEEVRECYKILEENAKKHNKKTPEFPVKFYLQLFRIMKDFLIWSFVKKDDKYLATIINLVYKDTIICWDRGSYRLGLQYRPNDILIWETIKWGCENGYKYFNLGGSPKPGLVKFKESWGGNKKDYFFYYRTSPLFRGIKYIGNTIRGLI